MLNKGIFWVNIVISKLNLLYRYCLKLIGELRKEREFRQHCCRNSTKIRREKDEKVERERRGISATLLFLSVLKKTIAAMSLSK